MMRGALFLVVVLAALPGLRATWCHCGQFAKCEWFGNCACEYCPPDTYKTQETFCEDESCKLECVDTLPGDLADYCKDSPNSWAGCCASVRMRCGPDEFWDESEEVCRNCTDVPTYTHPWVRYCIPCKACGPGQRVKKPCGDGHDTICETCPEGEFRVDGGHFVGECDACAECGVDGFETSPCNSTADRECQACSTCGNGTYRSRNCEPYADAECTECTVCDKETTCIHADCTPEVDTICYPCGQDAVNVDAEREAQEARAANESANNASSVGFTVAAAAAASAAASAALVPLPPPPLLRAGLALLLAAAVMSRQH